MINSVDFSSFSTADLDKILCNPDKMQELREYLRRENEVSEEILSDSIDAHIYVLAEIEIVNKKKVEAVDNEDFELAAKCKH